MRKAGNILFIPQGFQEETAFKTPFLITLGESRSNPFSSAGIFPEGPQNDIVQEPSGALVAP